MRSSDSATRAAVTTARDRAGSTCILSHSQDGIARRVSAAGCTHSRSSGAGSRRALAVPVHEHPESRERLLPGHLLLEDRGHQRLHDQAAASQPPVAVPAPRLDQHRVRGLEAAHVVGGAQQVGHRVQRPPPLPRPRPRRTPRPRSAAPRSGASRAPRGCGGRASARRGRRCGTSGRRRRGGAGPGSRGPDRAARGARCAPGRGCCSRPDANPRAGRRRCRWWRSEWARAALRRRRHLGCGLGHPLPQGQGRRDRRAAVLGRARGDRDRHVLPRRHPAPAAHRPRLAGSQHAPATRRLPHAHRARRARDVRRDRGARRLGLAGRAGGRGRRAVRPGHGRRAGLAARRGDRRRAPGRPRRAGPGGGRRRRGRAARLGPPGRHARRLDHAGRRRRA